MGFCVGEKVWGMWDGGEEDEDEAEDAGYGSEAETVA